MLTVVHSNDFTIHIFNVRNLKVVTAHDIHAVNPTGIGSILLGVLLGFGTGRKLFGIFMLRPLFSEEISPVFQFTRCCLFSQN